uniref:Uncharacterized protein n=1 Tax=Arundo donax TaxID=35708 RepID=A0A0A9DIY5_ARUDO
MVSVFNTYNNQFQDVSFIHFHATHTCINI